MAERGKAMGTIAQLARLRDPRRRVTAATNMLEQLRVQEARISAIRDEAVAQLHLAGLTYQQIAAAAGLTRGRVAQIIRRARTGQP